MKSSQMRLSALVSIALIATPSIVSAQSVLERVIGQIDNATNLGQVNGTYANIAESVSDRFTTTTTSTADYVPDGSEMLYEVGVYDSEGADWTLLLSVTYDMLGTSGTVSYRGVDVGYDISASGVVTITPTPPMAGTYDIFAPDIAWLADGYLERIVVASGESGSSATAYADGAEWYTFEGINYYVLPSVAGDLGYTALVGEAVTETTTFYLSTAIDGSINNVLDGIDGSTQEAVNGGVKTDQRAAQK